MMRRRAELRAQTFLLLGGELEAREREGMAGVYNGLSEASMRGQFRAWARFMTPPEPTGDAS